jgi:peptidoglycan hydrolase-like protein with peptidoglycan-binding domain
MSRYCVALNVIFALANGQGRIMSKISRRVVIGAAAAITATSTAFITTTSAHAATATPGARAVLTAAGTKAVTGTKAVPARPATLTWPLVTAGANGEIVKTIQYLLIQRIGASLTVDGAFGAQTTAAVKKFQTANKLAADGQVGSLTWAKLIIQVQSGAKGSAVQAVQHSLHFVYGFTSLAIDGNFGPATQAAVKSFQTKYKLSVDGVVGTNTWNALVVNES